MPGRRSSGAEGSCGKLKCALEGHFGWKWASSSHFGTGTVQAGGGGWGSEAARSKAHTTGSRWVSGRWGPASGLSDGGSQCVLQGHFMMK